MPCAQACGRGLILCTWQSHTGVRDRLLHAGSWTTAGSWSAGGWLPLLQQQGTFTVGMAQQVGMVDAVS